LVATQETLGSPYGYSTLFYLHLQGFPLLFWGENNKSSALSFLLSPDSPFEIPTDLQSKLFLLDSTMDYRYLLEEYGLTRDHVEVLQGNAWHDLLYTLKTNIVFYPGSLDESAIANEEFMFHSHGFCEELPFELVYSLSKHHPALRKCMPESLWKKYPYRPFEICQYDPQLANFCETYHAMRNDAEEVNKYKISLSPNILTNLNAAKINTLIEIVNDERLMQILSVNQDNIFQLMRSCWEINRKMYDIEKWHDFIFACADVGQCEYSFRPRLSVLQNLKDEYPESFENSLKTFFNMANPNIKLFEGVYNDFIKGNYTLCQEILFQSSKATQEMMASKLLNELSLLEILDKNLTSDYYKTYDDYDENDNPIGNIRIDNYNYAQCIIKLGCVNENTASNIIDLILEKNELIMQYLGEDCIKTTLCELALKHINIAKRILTTAVLRRQLDENEVFVLTASQFKNNIKKSNELFNDLKEKYFTDEYACASFDHIKILALAHIEIAEQLILDFRLRLRVNFWDELWFAHPTLLSYLGQIIVKNIKKTTPLASPLITCAVINKREEFQRLVNTMGKNYFNNLKTIRILSENHSKSHKKSSNIIFSELTKKSSKWININGSFEEWINENGNFASDPTISKNNNGTSGNSFFSSNNSTSDNIRSNAPPATSADPDFLYISHKETVLKELNAAGNTSKINFKLKPTFKIDAPHQTASSEKLLKKMMRMAWKTIFCYKESTPTLVEPFYIDSNKSILTPALEKEPNDIKLTVIDFNDFTECSDGGYLIPVLSQKQKLKVCINGEVRKDQFGRWVLYPNHDADINDCQLVMSVPEKMDNIQCEEYIDSSNFNKITAKNSLSKLDHAKISNFFVYGECKRNNDENVSCDKRVRNLLMQKPNDSQWFYGISGSGTHAYLVVQKSNGKGYARIDLGGTSNYSEEYLSISNEAKQRIESNIAFEETSLLTEGVTTTTTKFISKNKNSIMMRLKNNKLKFQDILNENAYKKLLFEMPESSISHLVLWANENIGVNHVYIITHFSQFDFDRMTLKIKEDDTAFLDTQGFLFDFFENAKQNIEQQFILFVHLDQLSPSERVRLNTTWDSNQTIQGHFVPRNIRIITQTQLDLEMLDHSLYSRQDLCLSVSNTMINSLKENTTSNNFISSSARIIIDLCAYPDWKATLFGPIILHNNHMAWQKSSSIFLAKLKIIQESGNFSTIVLKNIFEEHRTIIQEYIDRSQVLGYFLYHGYRIICPKHISFIISSNDFNFEDFSVNEARLSITLKKTDVTTWVNTYMFDHLLKGKIINNEQKTYESFPGLIQLSEGQLITIKITSLLSDSQWHCLMYEANKYNVTLNVLLINDVLLPDNIATLIKSSLLIINDKTVKLPNVYLSNFPNELLENSKFSGSMAFDIEDLSFQDLFFKEKYEIVDGQFTNFTCEKSELLLSLEHSESVVLKGQFSPVMLHYFHAILASGLVEQSGQSVVLQGQLTLIIEAPELKENNQEEVKKAYGLSWLPKVECCFFPPPLKVSLPFYEEDSEKINQQKLTLLDLSLDKADAFILLRKKLLLDTLNNYPWVILSGETGVGKSRLILALKEDNISIYYGLNDIEEWANDSSDLRKILFLDEYNLINKHLTLLAPLASKINESYAMVKY